MFKIKPEKNPDNRFSFSNLNTQVFFFVVLPVSILFLVITFGSIQLHQDAMRNLVGERDLRTVRSSSKALNEQLDHRLYSIRTVANRLEDGVDPIRVLDNPEALWNDFDTGMAVISADGELLSHYGDAAILEKAEQQFSLRPMGLSTNTEPRPEFSLPFQVREDGEYYVSIFLPVTSEGVNIVGVLSIFSLAQQTLADIIPYDNQGLVLLVGQGGEILYKNGKLPLAENILQHAGVSEALNGESGTTYFDIKNNEHVVAFSPISPTSWALVIEEPWHEVASPLLRYSETGSLVLVPVVIFALFALWFGTRSIIQPLAGLQDQAKSFSRGDQEAFIHPVGGINEIQTLQGVFKDMAERVISTQQVLKKYLGLITNSQEEERKRLARELHDETLQSLIALNQHIMMAKRKASVGSVIDELDEIEKMLTQTMTELRRLTRALRPIYLEDLGLVAALEMLALETSDSSLIPIVFSTTGTERRLPDPTEIAIFRITQEALNNITRHSEATKAEVQLSYGEKMVELRISDDGKGFILPESPTQLSNQEHFGLVGIFERAELIGARSKIQSKINQGTLIQINIPISEMGNESVA